MLRSSDPAVVERGSNEDAMGIFVAYEAELLRRKSSSSSGGPRDTSDEAAKTPLLPEPSATLAPL